MAHTQIPVFIDKNLHCYSELKYVLSLFKPVLGVEFDITDHSHDKYTFSNLPSEKNYKISESYWLAYENQDFRQCHAIFASFRESEFWLEKIFHLINCIQEFSTSSGDRFGRFTYQQSWQQQIGNIENNVVLSLMKDFVAFNFAGVRLKSFKTSLFLSHDIDTIFGELTQNGMHYLKTRQLAKLKKVIINFLLRRPGWANMDLINKLHDDHNIKHVYFWLITKATSNGIKNADYGVDKIAKYCSNSATSGLHKSSTSMSYADEMKSLPIKCIANRNHFLRFDLPHHWHALDEAGLAIDASLGFAEHHGFRNSYGYIFRPYNPKTGKAFNHLSVPLHLMDATFRNYLHLPVEETADTIVKFIEANKESCVLSILWHNTFFTEGKYQGYLQQYEKVLKYIVESGFTTLDFDDLLKLESNS
jgi:hypothetical protein